MPQSVLVPTINSNGQKSIGLIGHRNPKKMLAALSHQVHCAENPAEPVTASHALENLFSSLSPICQKCQTLRGNSCIDFASKGNLK